MTYQALVLADSLAPNGKRLTSFELVFPWNVLADFNTHRKVAGGEEAYPDWNASISSSSASSRAIPIKRMIKMVEDHPFIPENWPAAQAGMVAGELLSDADAMIARRDWLIALDNALLIAKRMANYPVPPSKEMVNTLLLPFTWVKVVATATDWENFLALRTAPNAKPPIQTLARMILAELQHNTPQSVPCGYNHLPYITTEDRYSHSPNLLRKISTARCARTSYLNYDGTRDPEKDLALFEKLAEDGTWSPAEHIGIAQGEGVLFPSGNFMGWVQYRKLLPREYRERMPVIEPDGSIRY